MPDRDRLDTRIAELRGYLLVARGRLAVAQAAVEEEAAGVAQIEGRLLEVEEQAAAQESEKEKP